jgi:ubiquinone/menaquinone biosynthesis C-methylase UbiE
MPTPKPAFVPAAGRDWLLPLYDPLNRLLGTARVKARLVDATGVEPGQRVLDLGCGTGDLAIGLKRRHPDAHVDAIDPDPKALARARAKAARAGVDVVFEQGFAGALPYPAACFDRVASSLVLHHLTRAEKESALREVVRVLRPGGRLHVLDFGPARGRVERALTHLFHRDDRMDDHLAGALPQLMRGAGLRDAREAQHLRTAFGGLALYEARAPA